MPHSGVRVTSSQLLGFILIGFANFMSLFFLQNFYANNIMIMYLIMSVADHCVLESGKTHQAVPWNELKEFAVSLVIPSK